MSNPLCRGMPLPVPPRPHVISLKDLSFISTTRFQVILLGSMFSSLSQWIWLSINADRRLWAAPIAWKSPVKWRLISVIGITWAYPPPAAPPFMPKHGPKLGSLKQIIAFFPMWHNPSTSPTLVVVFPSPAGVGDIAVTKINFPFSFFETESIKSEFNLALSSPNLIKFFSLISSNEAISSIDFLCAALAISKSLG